MFTVQRTMGSGEADGNELLDLMATDFGGPVSPQTGIVKTDGVGKMLPADFHPHHGLKGDFRMKDFRGDEILHSLPWD